MFRREEMNLANLSRLVHQASAKSVSKVVTYIIKLQNFNFSGIIHCYGKIEKDNFDINRKLRRS